MEKTKPTIFFQIRERLAPQQTLLFGIIPIAIIILFWFFLTWGKTDVVTIPDGVLDEGEPVPQPGRWVKDRTYLKIAGAKLITENEDKVIIFDARRYPLHDLQASEYEGGVKVTLKEGKFVAREAFVPGVGVGEAVPQASTSAQTPVIEGEKNPFIGRGGTIQPPKEPQAEPGKEITLIRFKYERVETRMFSGYILASPIEVVGALKSHGGNLVKDVGISFGRVAGGFAIAFLVTFPLGTLMGAYTKIRAMYSPLMVFGGYLPIPALVPLSLMFFGVSEMQKIMFLALAFGIYLLPAIVKAVETVDNVYLQTAYTLGANRFQILMRVLLGIAWPDIYDSMRLGFGVGWGYIILAEMVGQEGGVGAALILGQRRAQTAVVYLLLVVIVVVAYITDKLWEIVGEYLFPYRSLKR